jgi:hypothetical protein
MRSVVRFLMPVAALAAGVGAVVPYLGCSRPAEPPAPTTVRGRITFQGQPVAGGTVVFTPDRDRGAIGKPVRAETAADGTFQLQVEGGLSIPPGWYRVAIAAAPAASSGPVFPPRLRRPDLSTLVREVAPGKENVFEFAVEVPNG